MKDKPQDSLGNLQTNNDGSVYISTQSPNQTHAKEEKELQSSTSVDKSSRTSLLQSMAKICSHKPKDPVPVTEL